MPSSLLSAGIAALRDRSRNAVAAFTGAGRSDIGDDALALSPHGWSSALHDGGPWAPDSSMDMRRLLVWLMVAALVLVLIAVTNPSEQSFRAHLTELAFRRHLAHIRSSDEPEVPATDNGSRGSNTPNGGCSGADTPPVAPFRFANHVAITLRTPSLCYKSYFFFALALSAAPGRPAFLSDPAPSKGNKNAGAPAPDPTLAYFGVLGHWVMLGQVPDVLHWAWRFLHVGRRDKARKKASALDRPGVMEMRAVLPKDELPARPSGLVPKLLFKNESHKDLTDLLPLHSTPSTTPHTHDRLGPESRRGSVVNLIATPPTPPQTDPAIEITSPVLTALKTELAAAQIVLSELQQQLTSHNESVAASQAHLQSTVDELRLRRKEDDAERQDLKTKTKTLDDQKRQAEAARRDAEKRLKSVESVRDGILAKITAARGEIEDLKGNMVLSEKHIKIVNEEGACHLVETRKVVEERTKELGVLENQMTELETTTDELSLKVRAAEEKLKTAEMAAEEARKIAPEEEMMLMAAAYEAAASETYHHGQRHNRADSQWASQAAAYMAEAGMPHLDPHSYTARPAHSATPGYGHLSRAHPNESSYRNLSEKRVTDVSGFEDFGPGTGSRSLVVGRSNTPPQPAEEVDDHGSPNTQISSSFLDSFLPQGLVRSLEGDITPLDGAGSEISPEDDPSTFHDAMFPSPYDAEGGSGSSSGGGSPSWPNSTSPAEQERRVTPTSRFLPNATPTMHSGSASTLPGMGGALPSSRRWFSSSPSTENVSTAFNMFQPGVGSSDSLPLPFESAFAPSASEKRALKWPLLGKTRWSGTNNRSISGLDEITANLKDDLEPLGSSHMFSRSPGSNGLSAEELFNRAPAGNADGGPNRPSSLDLAPGGPWLTSRHFGNGFTSASQEHDLEHGHGSSSNDNLGSRELLNGDDTVGRQPVAERKPSFRFFSLRKGAREGQ